MFDKDLLTSIGATEKHIRFCKFLAEKKGDDPFVDYKSLNLMKIPDLVPNIWVLDFRKGISDGLKFLFSGTQIDKNYGITLMGNNFEKIYNGHYTDVVYENYRDVYRKRQAVFISRTDFYENRGKHTEGIIKALLAPCSTDFEVINYGIGLTTFEPSNNQGPKNIEVSVL